MYIYTHIHRHIQYLCFLTLPRHIGLGSVNKMIKLSLYGQSFIIEQKSYFLFIFTEIFDGGIVPRQSFRNLMESIRPSKPKVRLV